jgi:Leucine-rich repeat (LRR) protein
MVLDLSVNKFHGVIPPRISFLTKLVYIDLDSNYLTGEIPASLGSITNLQVVYFSKNQLNGRIPDEVMQMPNITQLHLNNNNLSGGIPEVWQMPNILLLDLSVNNLSGRIPQALYNASSLQGLSLASNMLGGTLPSNIGDALLNLMNLYLGSNHFEGHIPASLGNPPGLSQLDLSQNYFTGQIPSTLGNLSALIFLNLERNMLQSTDNEGWEFIHALGKCRSLERLSLSNNKLQGAIPNSIANLPTSLTHLLMSYNSITGTVPQSIGKFSSLVKLALDHNNLIGTIEWVGNMTKLVRLNLQSNSFVGIIPPSIGQLTQLTYLFLDENQFTGFIPNSLGNLKSLLELHLSYNNFKGGIPSELGSFTQLTALNLSSNKFSGGIPETLGKFEQIQTIQMDQNNFTGNVPSSFRNLNTLSMLNLSHNNLSGSLPAFLNDLKALTKLDISYNNFQGDVPTNGVYANAAIISLDGNPGLCGGVTDLHLRSCHVGNKRVGVVNYLIKILIPIFGFMSLVLLVYFLFLEKKTRRANASEKSFGEHFEKVTYNDLAQATGDFSESNLIGRGSYGSVYRGKLKESKMEVAVKVFNLEMQGAERSFLSECEALRSIQHRNLLPIITACSTVDNVGNVFKALVYELMPNGSLDTWLHHKGDEEAPKRLGFSQRISIAINVADALDYLHYDCGRPTVHCDLKPSNILLDDDMNALLGDFGIARFYQGSQSTWAGSISSIGVKGTIGYIPPGIYGYFGTVLFFLLPYGQFSRP